MKITFKKEDLLKPTKLFQSLGTMGVLNEFDELIVLVKETSKLESDPDPSSLNMIKVDYYDIIIHTKYLKNNTNVIDITNILLGDEEKTLQPSKGEYISDKFVVLKVKKNELDDITIEWVDLQEERSNKLDELGI